MKEKTNNGQREIEEGQTPHKKPMSRVALTQLEKLKEMHPYAKRIWFQNGRWYLESNGIAGLCKKCGCIVGAHDCKLWMKMIKKGLK